MKPSEQLQLYSDPIVAEVLQNRRDQLLQELLDESANLSLKTPHVAAALTNECNRISDQLDVMRCGALPDPLKVLPPELWNDILKSATNSEYSGSTPVDQLLILTLVSVHWRNMIVAIPDLWAHLVFGPELSRHDSHAQLETALYLSQECPLSIRMKVRPVAHGCDLAVALLRPHASRIRHLHFEADLAGVGSDSLNFKGVSDIITSFDRLPILRSLTTDIVWLSESLVWTPILNRMPRVVEISGTDLPVNFMTHPNLKRLSTVNLDGLGTDPMPQVTHATVMLKARTESPAPLPAVKVLRITRTRGFAVVPLIQAMPNLTELTVAVVGAPDFMIFLTILHRIPLLRTLDVTIHRSPTSVERPGGDLFVMRSLTCLSVMVFSGSETADATRPEMDGNELPYDILLTVFPEVEFLSVTLTHSYQIHLAEYVRSLCHLRRLHLVSRNPHGMPPFLQSKTLEHLTLSATLSKFEFPRLSTFELGSQTTLPPSMYAHLTSLRIQPGIYLIPTGHFPVLRTISVGESTSDFLIVLHEDPFAFPVLEELVFTVIPEWDTLFRTLEKRNFLPRSRCIIPIQALTLRSSPHPTILRPLIQLLKCRFTTRPTDEELSISTTRKLYFDPTLTGCSACLASRISCSEPIRRGTTFPPILIQVHPLDGDPTDAMMWSERYTRYGAWNLSVASWDAQDMRRSPLCTRMLRESPIKLTKFT